MTDYLDRVGPHVSGTDFYDGSDGSIEDDEDMPTALLPEITPCIHCDGPAYRPSPVNGRRQTTHCYGCDMTTAYCTCSRRHALMLECSECHVQVQVGAWEAHVCPPSPAREPLIRALHLMRHEHGDLWSPQPDCGCGDWADTIIRNWP